MGAQSLLLPQLANAAVCQVDPASAFGMPFASIDDSTGIVFDGFASFVANNRAIEIIDSEVSVIGAFARGHYSHTAGTTAVYVEGESDVDLRWVGMRGSKTAPTSRARLRSRCWTQNSFAGSLNGRSGRAFLLLGSRAP